MPYRVRQKLKAADLMMRSSQYRSLAVQAIPTGTNVKITLATLVYNYGSTISISGNNTLTVNKTGLYAIGGGAQLEAMTGAWFCWVGNGSGTATSDRYVGDNKYGLAGGVPLSNVAKDMPLTAGTTLSLYVWHNHGSNRNIIVTAEQLPYLYARYLGDG
jgi:hypothetical protein